MSSYTSPEQPELDLDVLRRRHERIWQRIGSVDAPATTGSGPTVGDALDALRRRLQRPRPTEPSRWRRFLARHPLLATAIVYAAVVVGAAASVPLTGHGEEAIALVGERVFGVPPLPAEIALPPERSRVLDRDGNVLATLAGAENRRIVTREEIPQVMRDAVIATEDSRFHEHEGVDVRGIVRAAWQNFTAGEVQQGASTITQQYVKSVMLNPERTLRRKVTEATWAVRLEERMSKEDILTNYLNVVYFGDGNYGVAAASEYWFGRPVSDLDLPRAALLASMLTAPARVDLANDPASAQPGRDAVVNEMRDLGMVTSEEAAAARNVAVADTIDITPLQEPRQPMFVRHVIDVRISGGTLPAQLWSTYMLEAMAPHDIEVLPYVDLDRWDGDCRDDRDSFEDGDQHCERRRHRGKPDKPRRPGRND